MTKQAVVIGTGFGGLAAAIRLSAKGYRVTMFERLDAPGGRAYVHHQDGFTFDAGPTIITAPFLFEELWSLCGRRFSDDVDLRAMNPFYDIRFDDGSVFHYSGDQDKMLQEVARFNPDDVAGFKRFTKLTKEIYEIGFEQLGREPFNTVWDMLKVAPDLVRLQGYRSVYGLVSRYLKDPKLRVVFSFHPLLVGGNPFQATAVYALISHLERKWGVHYVMGGTGQLVRAMANLFRSVGGEIEFNQTVEQIVIDKKGKASGIRLANGRVVSADIVVSNADAAFTYNKLLPSHSVRRWSDKALKRSRSSMGLFVWYFGTKRQYPELPHHLIHLGPRYKGLLDDIFVNKVLAPDMSLYLHRPSATDPSLAPPGCDAFYVLSPVPNLDGDVDWNETGEVYRKHVEKRLSETVMPGLADEVITSRIMTPLDFQDNLLSYRGAAFGHEPILRQSAWFRPHNKSEDIPGLFLVGAGTHPGAGVPGVISSAAILERFVDNV